MDRGMDGVILICHPKFLRGHKKIGWGGGGGVDEGWSK